MAWVQVPAPGIPDWGIPDNHGSLRLLTCKMGVQPFPHWALGIWQEAQHRAKPMLGSGKGGGGVVIVG